MSLFASPDFGAGGAIEGLLCMTWAVVMVFVLIGLAWALRLLDSDSPKAKKWGLCVLLVSALIPIGCCFGPSHAVYLIYGNYPLERYPNNKVKEGMTQDEVITLLGTPHERYKGDARERWHYWLDAFGAGWFEVWFGPNGRVESTCGN